MGDWGRGVGKPDGSGGCWLWLVPGRDLLRDDTGRDEGAGLSEEKNPDCRLRGDGEGGICERVSIVLSDREGRGRRGSVRALVE